MKILAKPEKVCTMLSPIYGYEDDENSDENPGQWVITVEEELVIGSGPHPVRIYITEFECWAASDPFCKEGESFTTYG